MLIVRNDVGRVESDLAGGRVVCPVCGGALGPWGHARGRVLRGGDRCEVLRPRRGRCRSCGVTQVFLPDVCLARRRDPVEVIGSVLVANAGGVGYRRIAQRTGIPAGTVRGWVRRFKATADLVRSHFSVWAHRLDPLAAPVVPGGSVFADALEAIGLAARAATLRFGPRGSWGWASAMSGGWLLATRVHLWPAP